MKKYQSILSDKEMSYLKQLVGQKLYSIMSPSIDIRLGEQSCTFYQTILLGIKSATVDMKGQYIALNCNEVETEELDEYYNVSVKKQNYPDLFTYEIVDNKFLAITPPISSIHIYSIIKKVSVFTKDELLNGNHFMYDAALTIEFENKKIVCFSAVNMAHGFIMTWDKERIEEIIEECIERHCGK